MYVNFLSTYSDKKSCHTSTTLHTSTRGLSAIAELLVIGNSVRRQKLQLFSSVRSAVFRPCHRPTIVLLLVYCPVDNTLSEISLEMCCSCVCKVDTVMETTQLVLSEFKNFLS